MSQLMLAGRDVPTWVGTIVTSTSVSIAALSYRRSVSDKEREQASHVAAWVGIIEDSGKLRRVLKVANGSDASVYEVTAWVEGSAELQVAELPAKTTTTADLKLVSRRDMSSSRDAKPSIVTARMSFWMMEVEGTAVQENISQEPAPELEFRDAVGRWWRRMPDGGLKLVQERSFRFSVVSARYRIPLFGSIEFRRTQAQESSQPDKQQHYPSGAPSMDRNGQPPVSEGKEEARTDAEQMSAEIPNDRSKESGSK